MNQIEDQQSVAYTSKELTKHYDPSVPLRGIESEWIAKAVIHYDGNLVAASHSLGISRAKLYRRIQELKAEKK